mgnify:CR=1 FL=1
MNDTTEIILIDANKYLDLYRINTAPGLLTMMSGVSPYIFITQQIVDEVQRNKLSVLALFLNEQQKGLTGLNVNLPRQFANGARWSELRETFREAQEALKSAQEKMKDHFSQVVESASRSEDDVSVKLTDIFSNAKKPTQQQLRNARIRKERGNPPGKRSDPLGDEVTWEQLLSVIKGKKRLWIISRDNDYGTKFDKSDHLNSFLLSELRSIQKDIEVFLFRDTTEALAHFKQKTKIVAEEELTETEVKEIAHEERSLQPIELSRLNSILSDFDLLSDAPANALQLTPGLPEIYSTQKGILTGIQSGLTISEQWSAMQAQQNIMKAQIASGVLNADLSELVGTVRTGSLIDGVNDLHNAPQQFTLSDDQNPLNTFLSSDAGDCKDDDEN